MPRYMTIYSSLITQKSTYTIAMHVCKCRRVERRKTRARSCLSCGLIRELNRRNEMCVLNNSCVCTGAVETKKENCVPRSRVELALSNAS